MTLTLAFLLNWMRFVKTIPMNRDTTPLSENYDLSA